MPGDPRDNYIAYLEWDGPARLILQQLNRLQNTVRVILRRPIPRTRMSRSTADDPELEHDDAWLDLQRGAALGRQSGQEFLWLSERDGWRHI